MNNNPKYRLKKDTPEFEAGQMFTRGRDEYGNDCLFAGSAPLPAFDVSLIDDFDEWFEKVKSGWKPSCGDSYYYINGAGVVIYNVWMNHLQDRARYSMGNYFRTAKAAERYKGYLIAAAIVRQDEGVLTPEQINELEGNEGRAYHVGCMGKQNGEEVLCGCVMDLYDAWAPVGVILFDTEEHADASRKKHLEEWKTIANYDWSRE